MARTKTGSMDMEVVELWQAVTKMDGKFDVMNTKLDQILIQTTKTNSRVTHLEEAHDVIKENYLREGLAGKVEHLEKKIEDIIDKTAWANFVGKNSKYFWLILVVLMSGGSLTTILKLFKLF